MAYGRERRTSERCVIDFFVQEVLENRTYLHPATNLSTTGIYVMANDDRKAIDGTHELNLEFTLPTGQTVRTRGCVIHVDDHRGQRGLGIEFVDLDEVSREIIKNFVNAAGVVTPATSTSGPNR